MEENIACSKRGKDDTANRPFKNEWATIICSFFQQIVLNRLICRETVAFVIKSGNVKRHNETKHRSFEEVCPQMSEVRASKTTELRAQYAQSSVCTFYLFY